MRRALPALLVVAALASLGAGCGTGGLSEGGSVSEGKKLFSSTDAQCSSCHTLAHAGAQGKIGPNLDAAFQVMRDEDYPISTIREVVAKQIKYPNTDPATGAPGMPANLVTGTDVDDIAAYVACAAGLPVKDAVDEGCGEAGSGEGGAGGGTGGGGGGGSGGGSADGKAIFNDAGCSGCHTLSAAGASGTVGPNLDESNIDEAGAVHQIENGGGGMPPFKGQLSDEQIKAVAHFVVTERGK